MCAVFFLEVNAQSIGIPIALCFKESRPYDATSPIISNRVLTSDGNRTVPSREVPGRSRDGTGQDLETLKVPWSCQDRT